ncbi:MAG: hypothetical protein Q7V20_02325 [Aquabacterium sp.]|uniref:hypothetical protein n=1 Tax=Aquabacterium sp. TaxID=1872578 RepID=UPI0027283115|nr:hypothetical protein [Aquabacterium sp.]MDO9002273.1 hypothetical protein [Aquabacterium sp.]
MNHLHLKALTVALPLAALLGCATVRVTPVATGSGEAAYELAGTSIAQLEAEAQRLCPHGYDVRRQAHHYQRMANDQLYPVRLWDRITGNLNTPTNDKAQMAVLCKAPPKAPPP